MAPDCILFSELQSQSECHVQHNRLSMVTNLLRPSPLINGTSGRGASLCLKSFEWRWCDVWILLCLRFIHSFIHEHFRFISSAKVSHLFYFLRSQRQSHLYDLMSTPTATLVVCHSIRAAKAFDIYSYVCVCSAGFPRIFVEQRLKNDIWRRAVTLYHAFSGACNANPQPIPNPMKRAAPIRRLSVLTLPYSYVSMWVCRFACRIRHGLWVAKWSWRRSGEG